MKILIVGKGGREHALAWKCAQSPKVSKIFIAPGNPGTASLGENIHISDSDIETLAEFAQQKGIDLTIVGPETSLALGIADAFLKRGLKIFAPTAQAAKIESSKEFAKKLMDKYGIPTAKYESFSELSTALKYIENHSLPIVIKEDGLKAGKGVTIAENREEAVTALEEAFSVPDNSVVIEEYLEGFEFSLIALVHGNIVIPLEAAQDHKRVFDGDKGPNTGGMGVYSPVDRVTSEVVKESVEKILQPMADAMISERIPFTGFLFAGIMLTSSGVKTIEFNARFGDPEAEGILPRMESDLIEVIEKLLAGEKTAIEWSSKYSLGVVMASENYPLSSTVGAPVNIDDLEADTILFHMGTALNDKTLITNGGRVLIPVVLANTLEEAKLKAYGEIGKINCKKLFFRRDIGDKSCYNS